jgi:hypothetical protein
MTTLKTPTVVREKENYGSVFHTLATLVVIVASISYYLLTTKTAGEYRNVFAVVYGIAFLFLLADLIITFDVQSDLRRIEDFEELTQNQYIIGMYQILQRFNKTTDKEYINMNKFIGFLKSEMEVNNIPSRVYNSPDYRREYIMYLQHNKKSLN